MSSQSHPTAGVMGGVLGLGTAGILGPLSTILNPPWTEPPKPTAAGGTLGRPLTQGGIGRWLLELDLGGRLWRFADYACEPFSRVRNGTVVYTSGLSDLSWSFDAESVSISVRSGSADTWARQRRVLGPLRGRRFVLRRWYPNQVLEDAFVCLQGVVESASFGSPNDPATLQLSCERGLRALSREMIPSSAVVDRTTWPGLSGNDDPSLGMVYPLVIGCPGAARVGGQVTPATPGIRIAVTTQPTKLLIAGHRVATSEVTVFNLTTGEVEPAVPVFYEEDGRGRTVAMVNIQALSISIERGDEYAIGWDRSTGGGVLHRGRPVQGLGDLLVWGSDVFSSAVHDMGELEARRAQLNRFTVDTVVNETGVLWSDWLESNVLGLCELEEVEGRHGVYYQGIRHTTDRRLVRAKLVTGTAGGGYRVERVASVQESDEEIQNAITLAYRPFAESHEQFEESVTIDPTPQNGIVVEDLLLRDPRCAYSQRLFGPRAAIYETNLTADRATAIALAAGKAARHALPKLLTAYQGGRELLDLQKYDVVELWDTSPGAYFQGDLAIVTGLTLVDNNTVQIDLAVDTDPLKNPTVRQT